MIALEFCSKKKKKTITREGSNYSKQKGLA